MSSPVIVVGIGNAYRSDDSVGLLVLQKLQANNLSGVMFVANNGDGTALLETWTQDSSVILIDAAISDAPAGTILRFDALTQPLATDFFFASTHTFGIAEAIRLAYILQRLPRRLVIYALVGKNFVTGGTLSPEVASALPQLISVLMQELRASSGSIS